VNDFRLEFPKNPSKLEIGPGVGNLQEISNAGVRAQAGIVGFTLEPEIDHITAEEPGIMPSAAQLVADA
jgi:hypothetical protein